VGFIIATSAAPPEPTGALMSVGSLLLCDAAPARWIVAAGPRDGPPYHEDTVSGGDFRANSARKDLTGNGAGSMPISPVQ
jgi:hypothetical protein